MLEFNKLTLRDSEIIRPFIRFARNRTCDNSFGSLLLWRDYFKTEYAISDNSLILKYHFENDGYAFSVPFSGDIYNSITEIDNYCRQAENPLVFCVATDSDIATLRKVYPDITVEPEDDWSDYIYNAEDLRTLLGRKYNGQRNHINYFKREYPDHTYEVIGSDNIAEVRAFYRSVTNGHDKGTDIFHEEQRMTLELLENYELYGMDGLLLRANGEIVAFAIGETVGDTLFVHIERASLEHRGAYQMIVNGFALRYAGEDVLYINREEDVGDEGLRRAKQSYHPCELLAKNTVRINR